MTIDHQQNGQNQQFYPPNGSETPIFQSQQQPYGGQAPLIKKHSGPGIASFIIGLLAIVGLIIAIIMSVAAAGSLGSTDPLAIEEEMLNGGALALVGAGLLMIGSIVLSLIGLILGIIGAVLKNRKQVFSIIGIILNVLIIGGLIILMIIGAAVAPV
ncbi:hypothetical protein ACFQZE_00060 [Paenibacillus sp. GCM10027627]|uniref:hypothetical protein n=1 Tax=unclassified Paenibacillus TaxID=185978 RepID=UPI00362BF462